MSGYLASLAPAGAPTAAPGFEKIQRRWDTRIERWCAKILPGEYFVTAHDEAITTVLGSCISACMRDPHAGVGGMNHFMLHEDTSQGRSEWMDPVAGLATRYGAYAMEQLVNDLMKLGGKRDRLEVKLFGGGRILASLTDVGRRNIDFAHAWLAAEGLRAVAEDVGDVFPRSIVYFPATGKVRVRHLRSLAGSRIGDREREYLRSLPVQQQTTGEVELF
ncbi:MAG: chemoreceptor glutamine deamidase CheD [Proteobacteria bacterium]|nr:chemoreceptor glutamine deamidase CheD [Pseudomonadota bacterium]